ncbi:helix-turn-helix transcriptional regulator [Actinacidiphila alni]|uniref:helix-turn-helix transcriptional regulator n=1 Tax=Actinacidiphila alni TaxID=380248 RepID=UPI0033CA9B89
MPPALATAGWDHLARLGLVRQVPSGTDVIVVTPDDALVEVLGQQRELLDAQSATVDHLTRAIDVLTGRYRHLVAADSAGASVEIIRGNQRKRQQLIATMNERTRVTSDSMHPGPMPPPEIMESSLREDAALIARGVRVRAIYGRSTAGSARTRRYFTDLSALGAEVRLAASVPFDLLISDRDVAYLTVGPSGAGSSMVEVRGDVLIASYHALYEDRWLQAVPAQPDGDQVADQDQRLDVQVTVLRLMSNGLPDAQIARRLGISSRTLHRHIVQIMERLSAESRFQAGVIAGERGMLSPQDDLVGALWTIAGVKGRCPCRTTPHVEWPDSIGDALSPAGFVHF